MISMPPSSEISGETGSESTGSESDLLRTAREAIARCNWVVGRCAADWTQRYARGRTDADFAELVGLSADQVYQRRRVWETFGDSCEDYPELKWSHFYVALNWDDAGDCLQWAEENAATIQEMRAWRRALRGEDLSEPPEDASPLADDPAMERLVAISSDVRMPDEEGPTGSSATATTSGAAGSADDIPFAANDLASAMRQTSGDGYAPFHDGVVTPPAESREQGPAEKPPEQIAKRLINSLERMGKLLSLPVVKRLEALPDEDKQRLVEAVRTLAERVAPLESSL